MLNLPEITIKTLMSQITKMETKKKMILMELAMDALLASDRLFLLRISLSNFTLKLKTNASSD